MKDEINGDELWKLPDDIKKKVVKHKTPSSKKKGEISYWLAKELNRLKTHREIRAISKHIHPSTKHHPFSKAITAYKKSSDKIKNKVIEGKIHIMDLIKENKKELNKKDRANLERYNKAREVRDNLNMFYKDLKYFLEGSKEDREYLKDFLKPDKIYYIASLLSALRNENRLKSFKKYQGIKEDLK